MHTKTSGPLAGQFGQKISLRTPVNLNAPMRLLGAWIWKSDSAMRKGKRLALSWLPDENEDRKTIEELKLFSDHELFDIGLSRSDLTFEGLAIAGEKRARRQDIVAEEITELSKQNQGDEHGD